VKEGNVKNGRVKNNRGPKGERKAIKGKVNKDKA
jgi:hypothetical protein